MIIQMGAIGTLSCFPQMLPATLIFRIPLDTLTEIDAF